MKSLLPVLSTLFTALLTNVAEAEVVVRCQQSQETSFFQFDSIPLPAIDDDAASAKWQVVRGKPDNNSASLAVLNDGKIPSNEDSPRENFFFVPGTAGGCIAVDLRRSIEIAQVDSRTDESPGGQHAALISDPTAAIGKYRYLLFEIDQTATDDPFANTFFGEIDIVESGAAEAKRIIAPELKSIRFSTADETYHFTVDLTAAPELEQ